MRSFIFEVVRAEPAGSALFYFYKMIFFAIIKAIIIFNQPMEKTLFASLLAGFLLLSLAGCGSKPAPKVSVPAKEIAPIVEEQAPAPSAPSAAAAMEKSDQPQEKSFEKGNPFDVNVNPRQGYVNPFAK